MTTAEQTRYFKLRYETDRNFRERRLKANREWKSRNQQKIQAEGKIDNLIRTGKLNRRICLFCHRTAQAHHPDHNHPYIIAWLCPQHHKLADTGHIDIKQLIVENVGIEYTLTN